MTALLARPPEEGARLVALALLARVEAAARRLEEPGDEAALHDFRVALRRLRSVLAAYREALAGTLKKRHRRRLRELAAASGPGRDAEVAAGWVAAQRGELPDAQHDGAASLQARLDARRGEGYEEVRRRLAAGFAPLAEELHRRLGVYTREVNPAAEGGGESFGELVAREVRRQLGRLDAALGEVTSVADAEACHRARIAGKRLRYLLEPLAGDLEPLAPILDQLKRLQDLLGELNDAHVLAAELERAVDGAARERAGKRLAAAVEGDGAERAAEEAGWEPVEALLTLARRNRERRDRCFAELEAGWLGEGDERRRLAAAVAELLGRLDAGFRPPPPAAVGSAPTSAR